MVKAFRHLALLLLAPLLTSCFQTQINGSTGGSKVTIEPLRQPGNIVHSTTTWSPDTWISVSGQEKWDSWNGLTQLLLLGLFNVDTDVISPFGLYLVTASAGLDYDVDRNNLRDANGTPPAREWHAIMSGQQLLGKDYRVSPLTEAAYQWLAPELDELSDLEVLTRLNLAAQLTVTDINEDGKINSLDLGKWSMTADGTAAFLGDTDLLHAMQDALLLGATDDEVSSLAFRMIERRDSSSYGSSYWRGIDREINDKTYSGNDFLADDPANPALCTAGTTSVFARLRALKAINATRSLHDLARVRYSLLHDNEVQDGALIQAANNYISHFPAPEDLCFSEGGAAASVSSNLGKASSPVDPASDIISWTNDAYNVANIEAAGHRRWVINPFVNYTSYAQIKGFSVQKINTFDLEEARTPAVSVDYVAFPYSITPYRFLSTNPSYPTPWSLSIIEDKVSIWNNQHEYFSNAVVTVTRRSDGQSLAITDIYSDTSGFGVPNFLSWGVASWEHDTLYDVEISDIAMQSGHTRNISYPIYIDYAMILDIEEPLEAGDSGSDSIITGSLFDNDDKDSYQLKLDGTVLVEGNSQFSNQAFFVLIYDKHKQLVFASDQADSVTLKSGRYTVVASNCYDGGCYSGSKQYSIILQNQ